jgi:hypothetical protein
MDIHKPKAAHTWSEFAREIVTIVCGILIALGLEEGVRAHHDVTVADEARKNVRAEVELDLGFIQGRIADQECIDRRIDEIASLLTRAGDGPLDPRPQWLGHPGTIPMFVGRWQAATASGRSSLFPPKEQDLFDNLYGLFVRYNEHETREQLVWAHLRALETWAGPLGAAARLEFAEALQEARYEAWDLKYAGGIALQRGETLGIRPRDENRTLSSICLPTTTTRAEALRRLNVPYGEP